MQFNDWRLSHRLWLGFGAVLLLATGLAALSMARLWTTQHDFKAALVLDQQAGQAERWAQLTQLNVSRALSLAKAGGNPALQAFLDPQMKATSEAINALQKDIVAQANGEEATRLLARVAELRSAYLDLRKRVLASIQADPGSAQAAVEAELVPSAQVYLAAVDAFRLHQQGRATQQLDAVEAAAHNAIILIGLLAVVCVVCGFTASAFITRSVTRPLQQALAVTQRIAQCDLSSPVQAAGRDEVGQLLAGLDAMQQRLRDVVGTVYRAGESIQVASREVAAGSLDLSNRTEQAAANLQQTAASSEQISANVRNTADAALRAKTLAETASAVSTQGADLVSQLQQAMADITSQSARIGDITTLIDGIAFQTNLLALNAAVEAARAGEHGRGFAVVAGEVRALAGRAAAAARQIAQLVEGSSQAAGNAARIALTTHGAIQDATRSVEGVETIVGAIRDASDQQSEGVQQLNRSLGELDTMTQQNAALVEQSAAAAASLQDQAAALTRIVSVFRLQGDEVVAAEAADR